MTASFVGILRDPSALLDMNAWGRAQAALASRCSGTTATKECGRLLLAIRGDAEAILTISPDVGAVLMDGQVWSDGGDGLSAAQVVEASGLALPRKAEDPLGFIRTFWGGYALARYSVQENSLLLSTDRFGRKSLFFATTPAGVAFSSCLRSLVALVEAPTIDSDALIDIFSYRMLSGTVSLVRSIRQIHPGTIVEFDALGRATSRTYWRFGFPRQEQEIGRPVDDWEKCAHEAIESAVAQECAGQDRVNVFLSGGVDSAILAALAARSCANATALTLEIEGFGNPELERARRVAARIGLKHEVVRVTERDIARNYRWLMTVLDHPPRHINNLALAGLYQRAAENGGVVLAGVGADAFFGTSVIRRVRSFAARTRIRGLLGEPVAQSVGGLLARLARNGRLANLAEALRYDIEARCLRLERLEYSRDEERLVSNVIGSAVGSSDWLTHVWDGKDDLLSRARRLNFSVVSRADLLRHDRIGSALGVVTAHPFLAPRVFELARRLPDEIHWDGNVSKPVLRAICAKLVSPEVAYWSKMGFPTPRGEWLRKPLAGDFSRLATSDPILDQIVPRGERARLDPERDFELAWTLLNLSQIAGDMGLVSNGTGGIR